MLRVAASRVAEASGPTGGWSRHCALNRVPWMPGTSSSTKVNDRESSTPPVFKVTAFGAITPSPGPGQSGHSTEISSRTTRTSIACESAARWRLTVAVAASVSGHDVVRASPRMVVHPVVVLETGSSVALNDWVSTWPPPRSFTAHATAARSATIVRDAITTRTDRIARPSPVVLLSGCPPTFWPNKGALGRANLTTAAFQGPQPGNPGICEKAHGAHHDQQGPRGRHSGQGYVLDHWNASSVNRPTSELIASILRLGDLP